MRRPFNTTCDIRAGPGTATPGLLRATVDCRLVKQSIIDMISPGEVHLPYWLTLEDFTPFTGWDLPYYGINPQLADIVAVPSGTSPRWWVFALDWIDSDDNPRPYWRAYLAALPAPFPHTCFEFVSDGRGLLVGGSADWSFNHPTLGNGGVIIGGSATWYHENTYVSDGQGILLGGSADWSIEHHSFGGPGGILLGGSADWRHENNYLPAGTGVLVGGSASWNREKPVVAGAGGVLLGGSAVYSHTSHTVASGVGILLGGQALYNFFPGFGIVQSWSANNNTSPATANWSPPTTTGNTLFIVVTASTNTSGTVPTINTPSGWTSLGSTSTTTGGSASRTTIFRMTSAASRSGAENVTVSGQTRWYISLIEIVGTPCSGGTDKTVANSGIAIASPTASINTGTTGATTTAVEFVIATMFQLDGAANPTFSSPSAGWTLIQSVAGANATMVTYYKVTVATGTQTFAVTTNQSGMYNGQIITMT